MQRMACADSSTASKSACLGLLALAGIFAIVACHASAGDQERNNTQAASSLFAGAVLGGDSDSLMGGIILRPTSNGAEVHADVCGILALATLQDVRVSDGGQVSAHASSTIPDSPRDPVQLELKWSIQGAVKADGSASGTILIEVTSRTVELDYCTGTETRTWVGGRHVIPLAVPKPN